MPTAAAIEATEGRFKRRACTMTSKGETGSLQSDLTFEFHPERRTPSLFVNRRSIRETVAIDARIVLHNGWSTMNCVIRDLSEVGARLQASFATALPGTFQLQIPTENVIVTVRQMWRMGDDIGVRFIGDRRPASGHTH